MDYFFLPAMEAAAGCAAPPLHIVQKGSILFKTSETRVKRLLWAELTFRPAANSKMFIMSTESDKIISD